MFVASCFHLTVNPIHKPYVMQPKKQMNRVVGLRSLLQELMALDIYELDLR